jgi:hypothetical protein
MHDPVNTPAPPHELHPAWLLTPGDLAAIRADDALHDRLAPGDRPDETELEPVAAVLARWLLEVANGGIR